MTEFNQQKALEDYTELMRRIHVGAYSERSAEHHLTGTWPEDGVEESVFNLEELAARHDLEFFGNSKGGYWLWPMSEETKAARLAAQEYLEEREEEDMKGDGSGLHQCPYCYNLVSEEHEEFCRLNPNRNENFL